MSSLSASIFGSTDKGIEDKNSSLNSLFGASSTLPEQPKNLNFTEPVEDRQKRERREEKKRKRKEKTQEVETADTKDTEEAKDESPENEDEERTIFVGNLPIDITRKTLASMFKSCGKVKSARIRSVYTAGVKLPPQQAGNQKLAKKVSVNTNKLLSGVAKKTAQGYVVFEETESVEKALELNNTAVPGSNDLLLRVDRAKPTHDASRSVFVGGLPYKTDEVSLRNHFKNGCGFESDVIENVRIVRDSETAQCKGIGYILLKDKTYVPYALEMNESEYKKKKLRVMVCGKRTKGKKGVKKDKNEASGALKRIREKRAKTTAESLKGTKDKKKRGTKKTGAKKASQPGISKRAASEKKLDKRVKKIQKRLKTGMGKTKK